VGTKDKRKSENLLGTLLIMPFVVWLCIVFLYPSATTLRLSFHNQRLIGAPSQFVGLDMYIRLFKDADFWTAVMNSAVWTISSVVLQTVLGVLVAIVLNQEFFGVRFLRTWIILPWVIPYSVIAVMARWMLSSSFGVINWLLMRTKLVSYPINFLGSMDLAMTTAVIVNVWKWFPFAAVTYLAALQGIPYDLYEAARLDGCNRWQEFRYVTMPALIPTLTVTVLFMTFWNFNTFGLIYLLTAGGPATATTTLPILVYKKAFQSFRMSEASALSILMFLILLVYSSISNRLSSKLEAAN
jgi:multiple sugar transport system permease protein